MQSNTPLSKVIKTTKRHLDLLKYLGVESLGDLLTFFPRTYSDQSQFRKIVEIRTDEINTIKGTLSQISSLRTKNGKVLIKAKLSDETGSVEVIWFNQPYLQRLLHNGMRITLAGRAKFELGKITLPSPEFEINQEKPLHTGRIVPVYHETEGLNSKWLREKVSPLLSQS
jgi:ATP-dependent DNA helicase RecG